MTSFSRLLILLCLFGTATAGAQAVRVPGEIIVQLRKTLELNDFIADFNQAQPVGALLSEAEDLRTGTLNIHLISYSITDVFTTDEAVLAAVRDHLMIAGMAQFNHEVEYRKEPNDPSFMSQWSLMNNGQAGGKLGSDISAKAAWDISTGGVTAAGDSIVVAVVDNGLDLNHSDLAGNIWKNHDEVPGNNIDDDHNGRIDDYYGWNFSAGSNNISGGFHGTPVAGIIGARGDNSMGISGVNWHVKLMPVVITKVNEANVVAAYAYILEFRRRWNRTDGDSGAFISVINSSFGINGGKASDAPIWCAMFDSLGSHGILSVASTSNNSVNVDAVGDLPTTCGSPYLISVTNSTNRDELDAAYGVVSIDLAAPGTGTYSTMPGSTYASFGGTSASAPHVSGAVALLYSADCDQLAEDIRAKPDTLAATIRSFILDGVDPMPDLVGKAVTEGRLNLYASLVKAADYQQCEVSYQENGPGAGADQFGVLGLYPNPTDRMLTIEYSNETLGTNLFHITDLAGIHVKSFENNVSGPGTHTYSMNVRDLPPGVYFVYFGNGISQSPRHKVVIY